MTTQERIEEKVKELKKKGLGGLALIHVRQALTEISLSAKKEGMKEAMEMFESALNTSVEASAMLETMKQSLSK